jgi:YD repeat-containing protein
MSIDSDLVGNQTSITYPNGNLLACYVYGNNEQLVSMTRGSNTYFYHYYAHGNIVALTDSTGKVIAEYDYNAWGNLTTTGLEGTVENAHDVIIL